MADNAFKEQQLKEIEENYNWYSTNHDKLLETNLDKIGYYMILKNKEIYDFYPTYEEASKYAFNNFEKETFSIQMLEEIETINTLGFFGLI